MEDDEEKKGRVFISHSSDDTALAEQLKSELEKRSISCWLYNDILPGRPFFNEICREMETASRCILLVTQEFLKSCYFTMELNLALTRQYEMGVVFCIPVLHGVSPTQLPSELVGFQCLDQGHLGEAELLNRLETAIKS